MAYEPHRIVCVNFMFQQLLTMVVNMTASDIVLCSIINDLVGLGIENFAAIDLGPLVLQMHR